MHKHYILDKNGEPIPENDLMTWAKWFGYAKNRVVCQADFGPAHVSTVFLGLDHNWGEGPPVLWETMIFGGLLNDYQDRCSGSREQALAMHNKAVKKLKEHYENKTDGRTGNTTRGRS